MKRVSLVVALAMMFVFGFSVLNSEARLSSNNRRAVVLEAFYALRPSHDGSCDKFIGGNCVSSWNYLYNDYSAYSTMKSWYGCNSSVWTFSGDGSGCSYPAAPTSFYSNVAYYGYYGTYGRGGQCKYFANLILYRSGSDQRFMPSYANMWGNTESDLTRAVPGDILFANGFHTAIVVEIKRTSGVVTGLDVIDANFVSDSGSNREVIGRHEFKISQIQGTYRIWKGVSYYSEPYVP